MKDRPFPLTVGRKQPDPMKITWHNFMFYCATAALTGPGALQAAPVVAIDEAAQRVAAALAEGVALSLQEAPSDERGLVMIGTGLDEDLIKAIQQSSAASRRFVDRVAGRYPLSAETKIYMVGALIGFSEICADYPPPRDAAIDPSVLKLIISFRQGVRAGAQRHRAGKT